MALGAEHIATGHYARVREVPAAGGGSEFQLLKALDGSKDQSYFLHRLNQAQLSRTLFPGRDPQDRVRRIAHEIGLHNAAKKDSTGICFIGERPFREFLNRYLPTEPGPILTPEGQKGAATKACRSTRWASARAWAWAASRASSARTAPPMPGTWRARTWSATGSMWCRVTTIPGCCRTACRRRTPLVAGRPPEARGYGAKTRYRQADAACRLEMPPTAAAGVSASAMGRHAGPVRRAV